MEAAFPGPAVESSREGCLPYADLNQPDRLAVKRRAELGLPFQPGVRRESIPGPYQCCLHRFKMNPDLMNH